VPAATEAVEADHWNAQHYQKYVGGLTDLSAITKTTSLPTRSCLLGLLGYGAKGTKLAARRRNDATGVPDMFLYNGFKRHARSITVGFILG